MPKLLNLVSLFLAKFTTNTYDSSGQADTIQMWSCMGGGGLIYKIKEKDIFPEGCSKEEDKILLIISHSK